MIIGTQINGSVFSLKCKCRNKHCNAALCDYISASKQNHIYRKMFWSLLIKLQSSFDFPGDKQFSFENFVAQTFHPLSLCFQNP